jgi:hypothetical protein
MATKPLSVPQRRSPARQMVRLEFAPPKTRLAQITIPTPPKQKKDSR